MLPRRLLQLRARHGEPLPARQRDRVRARRGRLVGELRGDPRGVRRARAREPRADPAGGGEHRDGRDARHAYLLRPDAAQFLGLGKRELYDDRERCGARSGPELWSICGDCGVVLILVSSVFGSSGRFIDTRGVLLRRIVVSLITNENYLIV